MSSTSELQKQKNTLKLFGFIPLWSCKKRGGKYTYSLLGIPFWKVRKIENCRVVKYYLFNIPILRAYNQINTPTELLARQQQQYVKQFEKQMSEHFEKSAKQQQQLNEYAEDIILHKTMLEELYDVCSEIKPD
ncbi:MAG: hypothetical protein IJ770_05555 [Alphaproteobacteria bacterium]|nr:hypothetical protein [Alphaproteobacteria bacterium]